MPEQAHKEPGLGFALRIEAGRVLVEVLEKPLGEGIRLKQLLLEAPHVRFPFDMSSGPERFRSQRCVLKCIALQIETDWLIKQLQPLVQRYVSSHLMDVQSVDIAVLKQGFSCTVHMQPSQAGAFSSYAGFEVRPMIASDSVLEFVFDHEFVLGPANLNVFHVAGELTRQILAAFGMTGRGDGAVKDEFSLNIAQVIAHEIPPRMGFKVPDMGAAVLQGVVFNPGTIEITLSDEALTHRKSLSDMAAALVMDERRHYRQAEQALMRGDEATAWQTYRAAAYSDVPTEFALGRYFQLAALDPDRAQEAKLFASEYQKERQKQSASTSNIDIHIQKLRVQHAFYHRQNSQATEALQTLSQLMETHGGTLSQLDCVLLCAADAYQAAQQPKAASEALLKLLQRHKYNVTAIKRLFQLAIQTGAIDLATWAGERLVSLCDAAAQLECHYQLAALFITEARTQETLHHLERALRIDRGHAPSRLLLAKCHLHSHDQASALYELTWLTRAFEAPGSTLSEDLQVQTERLWIEALRAQSPQMAPEHGFDAKLILKHYENLIRLRPLDADLKREAAQEALRQGLSDFSDKLLMANDRSETARPSPSLHQTTPPQTTPAKAAPTLAQTPLTWFAQWQESTVRRDSLFAQAYQPLAAWVFWVTQRLSHDEKSAPPQSLRALTPSEQQTLQSAWQRIGALNQWPGFGDATYYADEQASGLRLAPTSWGEPPWTLLIHPKLLTAKQQPALMRCAAECLWGYGLITQASLERWLLGCMIVTRALLQTESWLKAVELSHPVIMQELLPLIAAATPAELLLLRDAATRLSSQALRQPETLFARALEWASECQSFTELLIHETGAL